MTSFKSREGYLMIDDRCSGGELKENAVYTCHGCHNQILKNPDRTRPRHWCSVHDDYLCDACELRRKLTGECKSLNAVMETLQEQAFKSINTRII